MEEVMKRIDKLIAESDKEHKRMIKTEQWSDADWHEGYSAGLLEALNLLRKLKGGK